MADNYLQTSYGFDPNAPLSPAVPMSSRSVTARGPDTSKTLVGALEAQSPGIIDSATDIAIEAKNARAEAEAEQNKLEAERKRREAIEIRKQNDDNLKLQADREERRRQKTLAYEQEEKEHTKKYGGSQDFWDNHPAGSKVIAGVAIALGGIGKALQQAAGVNAGPNAGLESVRNTVSQWHADRNKQLEIDREKLLRRKASIAEVDTWYEREKARNDAKYSAELKALATEFDSQAKLLKNPEARAKAQEEVAKLRLEAEKQKQFAMEGQRQKVNESGVTATATNSAPTADGVSMPGVPKIPRAETGPAGSLAPGAQRPATATPDPLAGLSEMGRLQMPGEQGTAQTPVTGVANMLQLKAPGELGGQRERSGGDAAGKRPRQGNEPTPAPAATSGAVGNAPVVQGEIDRKALAQGGVIYGHKGKPIAVIQDKKLAQDVNKQTSALVDYAGAIRKLGDAADDWNRAMLSPKSAGDVAAAKARFDQAYKDVRNKAKGAVATDALSDQEALAAIPIDRTMVLAGKHRASIDETFGALRSKIGSIYSSVGLDPDVAFSGLMGKEAPPAARGSDQQAPDAAQVQRAREAAKEQTARGERARAWLKERGL